MELKMSFQIFPEFAGNKKEMLGNKKKKIVSFLNY